MASTRLFNCLYSLAVNDWRTDAVAVALITEGPFVEITRTNLWGFVYLGLIGTGLAYALWFRGIDRLTASAAAYLGLLSPVIATLIGFFFLQETLSTIQMVGIVIVLASVLVGQQSQVES